MIKVFKQASVRFKVYDEDKLIGVVNFNAESNQWEANVMHGTYTARSLRAVANALDDAQENTFEKNGTVLMN